MMLDINFYKRILVIGTVGSGNGWNQLILFNNNPADRFHFGQADVAQQVADTIQNLLNIYKFIRHFTANHLPISICLFQRLLILLV